MREGLEYTLMHDCTIHMRRERGKEGEREGGREGVRE